METARMRLRRFTEADADDLAALHGDPEVMRYIDDPEPRSVITQEILPEILQEYGQLPNGMGRFVAEERESGVFLGWVSLRPASSVGLTGGTELGYRLRHAVWGHGYATEGARALVRRGFTELNLDRVVATTMTVNAGSRRVLEKTGLSLVRTFFVEWPEYLEGAEHGDVEYELTRETWSAQTVPGDRDR
ncbi:GNAT family N-acetyltransferase [Streptomyces zagrosensis]|nr:GNAT family N-acetyltransferase [Streptomyces zagrosensis]